MDLQRDQASPDKPAVKAGRDGLLTRLRKDIRGNTLAIVGAALIPLTAMIGSGVDLSRAYMAHTRLQSACDAASLATRRAMTGDDLSDTAVAEGTKYFGFNFPQGLYQTAAFTPQITKPVSGTVEVSATTTIPTQIMRIFGFQTLPLAVDCKASQNFVNTDIVLVLDTTGSMMCTPEESSNCGRTTEISTSRIAALRSAVLALYDQLKPIQDQLEAGGMRLRYGVVPYSSAVNVGQLLYSQNPSYISDSWTYQSRIPVYSTSSAPVRVGNSMTSSQCGAYTQSRTPAHSFPATAKVASRPGTGTNRPCDITTITYTTGEGDQFASLWWYTPTVLDTSAFKTSSSSVPLPTATPGNGTNSPVWDGCVEERDTVDTIDASSSTLIPAGAYDLNIDLIPNSNETRWRPHWPDVEYTRSGEASSDSGSPITGLGQAWYACPTAAKRLAAWTRDSLSTYLNTLQAIGGTYHDIGMIWGARLISAAGVFADSPTTYNGMPVSKHIIFMTDGDISPDPSLYGTYGIEKLDQRITGDWSTPNQLERHKQRFLMMCNAVRSNPTNATVWVVGLSTTMDSSMTTCTGDASKVSTASTQAQLIQQFTLIGKNIGTLRLTQ